MISRRIVHVSDLHIGASRSFLRVARSIRRRLDDEGFDHVVITGDLTHRGRPSELRDFDEVFGDLVADGRATVVPGNHDRLSPSADVRFDPRRRVERRSLGGLEVVRIDSTGPHNRSLLAPHGHLESDDLREIDRTLAGCDPRSPAIVLLHHHPVPLPADSWVEGLAGRLGWLRTEELSRGKDLLDLVRGRCDLVLHGHRHVPHHHVPFPGDVRPLHVYGAGCSTALARVRTFAWSEGRIASSGWWRVGEEMERRPRTTARWVPAAPRP